MDNLIKNLNRIHMDIHAQRLYGDADWIQAAIDYIEAVEALPAKWRKESSLYLELSCIFADELEALQELSNDLVKLHIAKPLQSDAEYTLEERMTLLMRKFEDLEQKFQKLIKGDSP